MIMMKKLFPLLLFFILSASLSNNNIKAQDKGGHPQKFVNNVSVDKTGFSGERLIYIDSMINKYVAEGILPNAVTFVACNGTVVHHKAYGWRNMEKKIPLEKSDIFRIASQTKAITSVALMTLYEKGKFVLDDPISKYIPEFKNPQVLIPDSFNEKDTTYTTRPAQKEITIRHLLTHTSGICYGILGGGVGNKIFAKEKIPAVNSLDNITIEQAVKKIARMPLMNDPGAAFLYGMNTDVIAYLIEVLSGKPFDIYMRETVLDPLGMNDTYFYLPSDKAKRLVTLYSSAKDGLVFHQNKSYQYYPVEGAKTFLSGGAGLCGPVEDYAKFCQMMLNGGTFNNKRILGRKTVELMTMNQIGDLFIWGNVNKFGLGFELTTEKGAAEHLKSQGSYKWGGMYYTDYLIDPKENLILLFYTNVQPYQGPKVHELFHNLVYQALK